MNSNVLGAPPVAGHQVQIYENRADLARGVARYLAQGLQQDEAVVVVATRDHWEAFAAVLQESGVDLAPFEVRRQVTVLDAEETLSKLMVNGAPERGRFEEVIGGVLHGARKQGRYPRLRAYGEMVDLLWRAGRLDAAIRLEELWTDLMRRDPFLLLCGYRMNLLGPELDADAFQKACDAHSKACLAHDPARLEAAVDRSMDEVLGPGQAAALRPLIASTLATGGSLGRAESTILWMRRNLPVKAQAVLAFARRHYEEVV